VTNALPTAIETLNRLDRAKVMIFTVMTIYEKDRDISVFSDKLIAALHFDEAVDALDKLDEFKIERDSPG
jgi:hypothetical protein